MKVLLVVVLVMVVSRADTCDASRAIDIMLLGSEDLLRNDEKYDEVYVDFSCDSYGHWYSKGFLDLKLIR